MVKRPLAAAMNTQVAVDRMTPAKTPRTPAPVAGVGDRDGDPVKTLKEEVPTTGSSHRSQENWSWEKQLR